MDATERRWYLAGDCIVSPDDGVHRTALLLHALHQEDQQVLLSRLEPQAQERLRPLLQELADLGIPADRDLIAHVMAHLTSERAEEVVSTSDNEDAAAYVALHDATAQDMLLVLGQAPPEMVARLLACRVWPWSAMLLEALEPLRRHQIEQQLHAITVPAAAMRSALVRIAARRLPELVPQQRVVSSVPSAGYFSRVVGAWQKLGRYRLFRWRKA
jgi:hypothetical protein